MIQPQHITEYYINAYLSPGDTVVDATAGNGYDTLKLCAAVGDSGKVYAFDIQEQALEKTSKRLTDAGLSNAVLIKDSHSNLDKYVNTTTKAVIFNLGYLPGGDHKLQTKYNTTIEAIEKSLDILSSEGFISITVYYGTNSGTEEKDMVMSFLKELNHKLYTVMVYDFFNRPNNPPLTIIITKNQPSDAK